VPKTLSIRQHASGRKSPAVARWVYEIAARRSDAEFGLMDIKDYNLPLLDEPVRKLIEGGVKPLVPSIWALEVANALLVAERRKRVSQTDSAAAWTSLQKLPIEIDRETGRRAGSDILVLARQQKLSVYDAAYLELAMRKGTPLASLDEPLRAAA
jgi:predicted nucleic acid-binding protein